MLPAGYVELRCRSAFSFLRGASLPEDLIERAAALGHDALALSDRHGVYGAPRFFTAARRTGVRALVGAEVVVADAGTLALLVEDRTGYANLCRLLTAAAAGRPKGDALATWEQVEEHAAGLHCLAGGAEGPARRLADLAAARGVPVVATNDVRHTTPAGRPLLDVLTCIRHGTTLDRAGRLLLGNAERHLKSPAEMAALFRDSPAAVHRSRHIAERCGFTLADLPYR